ncbi:hypothetical protein CgunFtcFv8_020830 [Champsocephalus gunnari]|uniref:Uncharacterized protein n=1 Tax=Champsocephalus gunnari TaxID=52237 RepID=A0AAN8IES1_CHAGU|nr:hypothetical protein CgunFtcFv8_020830 [Champsocephalus gunnari]
MSGKQSRIASGKRIRIASGTRVRTRSGTRRTILKRSWTSAGPYLPQIRFADPIQFRADVRLYNGPSPFGGSGPDPAQCLFVIWVMLGATMAFY